MAQVVRYKKPRRFNVVTATLLVLALALGYLLYVLVPPFLLEQEAYRVLEETGSKLAGQYGHYRNDASAREQLRQTMTKQLRQIGVDDPDMETWIELRGPEVRIGVAYAVLIAWPFDVLPPHPSIHQVEHVFALR